MEYNAPMAKRAKSKEPTAETLARREKMRTALARLGGGIDKPEMLILSSTILTMAASAIPVPILDEWAMIQVQRSTARGLAKHHQRDLGAAALAQLTMQEDNFFTSGVKRVGFSLMRRVLKELLREGIIVWEWVYGIDQAIQVYFYCHLLERLLRSPAFDPAKAPVYNACILEARRGVGKKALFLTLLRSSLSIFLVLELLFWLARGSVELAMAQHRRRRAKGVDELDGLTLEMPETLRAALARFAAGLRRRLGARHLLALEALEGRFEAALAKRGMRLEG